MTQIRHNMITALALQVLCGVVAVSGCGANRPQGDSKPTSDATSAPQRVPVVIVESRPVQSTIDVPATLIGFEQARLMAKIDGYVKQVHVDIGDEVTAGDVLVSLESVELDHEVEKQQKLANKARSDIELAAAELNAAKAKLAAQEAMIELRTSELARIESLVTSGALNRARREEAQFALKSASASMAELTNAVGVAEARLKMAEAHTEVAAAELNRARTMADYQTIRAPFTGVITERHVDPGDYVEPATASDAKPLVEIAMVDTLRAIVHVTMDDAGMLKVGSPVHLSVVGVPDHSFEGKLSRTSGVFDDDSRMMRAEVDIANPSNPDTGLRPLRAGSYGTATIVSNEQNLPAVPTAAVGTAGDKRTVTVVSSDGTCLRTVVSIGVDGGDIAGIATGVETGDRIVADAAAQVEHDQKLSPDQIELRTY